VPSTRPTEFANILVELCRHQVDFIIVGGVAAALEGAPFNTLDLDIVHRRTTDNIVRLLAALRSLNAVYRHQEKLKPEMSHLATAGHQLLMTRDGPLDVLGAIGRSRTYEDLLPRTVEVDLEGLRVRVLELETLIAVKEEVAGEKDLAVLPLLRRTLAEKRRS